MSRLRAVILAVLAVAFLGGSTLDAPVRGKGPGYFHDAGTTMWYLAGAATENSLATAAAATVNTLFGQPFVTGRGGTIDRVIFNVTAGGTAGSVGRTCIYTNTSDTTIYPSSLVAGSGEFDTTGTGNFGTSAAVSIVTPASSLYWAVLITGTAAPTVSKYAAAGASGILGWSSAAPPAQQVGLTVASTYGAGGNGCTGEAAPIACCTGAGTGTCNCPPTFPAGASFQTSAPAIWLRYSN